MSNALRKYANDAHQRVVRMLDYCLILDSSDIWLGLVRVLKARLSASELEDLSFASLRAQEPGRAELVVEAVFGRSGTPLPPLLSVMDEASYWADCADPRYINACVLAGYNRMSPEDKSAFLDCMRGKTAA